MSSSLYRYLRLSITSESANLGRSNGKPLIKEPIETGHKGILWENPITRLSCKEFTGHCWNRTDKKYLSELRPLGKEYLSLGTWQFKSSYQKLGMVNIKFPYTFAFLDFCVKLVIYEFARAEISLPSIGKGLRPHFACTKTK